MSDERIRRIAIADGSAWFEAMVIDKDTGRVGLGTNTPTSRVTVSENAASPPPAAMGTLTHLVQADGVACRFFLDAFAGNAQLNFRRANGTNASRVALASGNSIGRFSVFGYGTTGFSSTSRGGFGSTGHAMSGGHPAAAMLVGPRRRRVHLGWEVMGEEKDVHSNYAAMRSSCRGGTASIARRGLRSRPNMTTRNDSNAEVEFTSRSYMRPTK